MNSRRHALQLFLMTTFAACLSQGCTIESAHTSSRDFGQRGDRQLIDPPETGSSFEECVQGGQLFKLYCSSCHNGRPLAERDFRSTEAAFTHMRTQCYLTGEEHRKLIHYLRRWHDLNPPVPDVEPSAKRFFYDQPISELRPDAE